jgi:hypothetical protein
MATNARIKPVGRAIGRTWDEWLRFMDGVGAMELDHKAAHRRRRTRGFTARGARAIVDGGRAATVRSAHACGQP